MTRDEAVAAIHQQLGFRSDQTANIITNLKLAQIQLEQEPTLPWFLTSEKSYIRTTIDEERLAIPSGFLSEIDEARLVYIPEDTEEDTSPVALRKDDYDVLAEHYKDSDPGPPEAYALTGDYFRIFPTPDDLYYIEMIFKKEAVVLDTNIENTWLKYAPFVIMGFAGGLIATALRDTTSKQIFDEWLARGKTALVIRNTSRDVANTTPQMGGPH